MDYPPRMRPSHYWVTNWDTKDRNHFQNYKLWLAQQGSHIWAVLFDDGMVAYSDQVHLEELFKAEFWRKPVAGLFARHMRSPEKVDDLEIRGLNSDYVAQLAQFTINAGVADNAWLLLRIASHQCTFFYDGGHWEDSNGKIHYEGTSNLWYGPAKEFEPEAVRIS